MFTLTTQIVIFINLRIFYINRPLRDCIPHPSNCVTFFCTFMKNIHHNYKLENSSILGQNLLKTYISILLNFEFCQ